jgi:hypothetical protein
VWLRSALGIAGALCTVLVKPIDGQTVGPATADTSPPLVIAGDIPVFPQRAGALAKIKVPYPPGEETVYPQHKYREPGTSRVLYLAYTTPYEDDTLDGAKTYKMWYALSTDGEKRFDTLRPLVQSGPGYDRLHPIRVVHIPRNSYVASIPPPSRASNGEIMVPFQFWPLDEKGELYHPEGGWTFLDSGVLVGRWTKDGRDIEWDLGETVRLPPDRSTRGGFEPAIVELAKPGRFLMILRGSNGGRPHQPGHKWKSVSEDYCRTWSKPAPLGYSNGEAFYSPSACSDIRRHGKNRKLYWIGNICPENPKGNNPRYPLVIGQIDEEKLGIIKETVRVIDSRDPKKDSPQLQLSNFSVAEDPTSGAFIIQLSRLDYEPGGTYVGRQWPAMRYEVEVDGQDKSAERRP